MIRAKTTTQASAGDSRRYLVRDEQWNRSEWGVRSIVFVQEVQHQRHSHAQLSTDSVACAQASEQSACDGEHWCYAGAAI